ncbi:hypothetical protein [Acinetobacter brisouii]|uniref:hypothetical protein n=1 Tax=Acinetobacter brisouii TaxID=396323 RepID=UPI0005F79362|nr:hypothetical protein [Acinetobacter brisouii]KJV38040.1 hypothetical protein VH98_10750 [Acinetobacter brisouii]
MMIQNIYLKMLKILLINTALVSLTGCFDKSSDTKQIHSTVTIGDLGGVPVNLPNHIVGLVEYDGDPSWGEKRVGDIPERTYQSKINSFGFDIRYTDGQLLDKNNANLKKQYDVEKLKPDNPWILVGINSGKRYYGKGSIHRLGEAEVHSKTKSPVYTYAKLADKQYGLEVYAPPGVDPKTNMPWRENQYAEDIFIQRNQQGEVAVFIKCSNRQVRRPPCTQYFDLEPNMHLDVYAVYSRWDLEHWQQIQSQITQAILNFRKI